MQSARATAPGGKTIPLTVDSGRLTPKIRLTPGERITVDVVVRRPGALAWALGRTRHERLVVTTPVVHPSSRWLSVGEGSPVGVRFDGTVAGVAVGSGARRTLRPAQRAVSLGSRAAAGSTTVAVAARTWERLQPPTRISWFPKTSAPAAVSAPAAGAKLSPLGGVRLSFAEPVKDALGGRRPTIAPKVAGRFSQPDDHTLVFTPTGTGYGIGGATVQMTLPKAVALASTTGAATRTTRQIAWTVPPASTTRLQQLLAQAGYLPLAWTPAAGADVPRTRAAQARAAVDAPAGTFSWRYANTPGELKDLWAVGRPSTVLRGAIMRFQDTHHLTVDGFAGPSVWNALIADAIAGKHAAGGYSYVYVHRDTQRLALWHDGHTVLTSPGNTGVKGAVTALGDFPVFEHLASTTMRGVNPDGSHYDDPGVRWVSYFNGGDALHAFQRASYGTPQSDGCVELPEAAAKKIWPYTPIGTVVTIEH